MERCEEDGSLWEELLSTSSHDNNNNNNNHTQKKNPLHRFVQAMHHTVTSSSNNTYNNSSSNNNNYLNNYTNLSEFGIEGVQVISSSSFDYHNNNSSNNSSNNQEVHKHDDDNDNNDNDNNDDNDYVFLKKLLVSAVTTTTRGGYNNRNRSSDNNNNRSSSHNNNNDDLFFQYIYNYYYHRGITPIICNGLVDLVSLFFTLYLSVFLFAYLDVMALTTCKDETSCYGTLNEYIFEKPFSHVSVLWNNIIRIYILLFFVYGCISTMSFTTTLRDAMEAKDFYENELGISKQRLAGGAIEWDEITQKIAKLHDRGSDLQLFTKSVTALSISQRVLRRENWFIGLLNCGVLDLRIPLPYCLSISGRSKSQFLSTSLEWSIYLCIFGFMYNHNYRVRPSFIDNPRLLQQRFFICGVLRMLFTPFLHLFMVLHFLLVNIYDWRSSRNYMGPRKWSGLAR